MTAGTKEGGMSARREARLGGGVVVPYPEPSSVHATKVGKGNRRKDTKPEVRLRSQIHRRGLRFRKDYPVRLPGGGVVRPDVVFTRARVAVFIDGCFWHCCPQHGTTPRTNRAYWAPKLNRNVERDRRVTEALESDSWCVIRVWEHEDIDEVARRLDGVVRSKLELQG